MKDNSAPTKMQHQQRRGTKTPIAEIDRNRNRNRNARRRILVVLGILIAGLACLNVFVSIHHDHAAMNTSTITRESSATAPSLFSEPVSRAVEAFSKGNGPPEPTPIREKILLAAKVETETSENHEHAPNINGRNNNNNNGGNNEKNSSTGTGRKQKAAKKTTGRASKPAESSNAINTNINIDTTPKTTTALVAHETPAQQSNRTTTTAKIQLLLSQQEKDWIRKRTILFRDEIISIDKVRGLYNRAFNDPLSRSGHPDHNFAMDSGNNTNAIVRKLYDANKLRAMEKSSETSSVSVSVSVTGHGDPSEGPWLDFMVAGNPKCGTTTLMANLRRVAPMPVMDFCTGVSQTLRNAYLVWPQDPNCTAHVREHLGPDPTLWLRGSKCPRFLSQNFLLGFASVLPKTKLIVGIRHPVTWFESFWSMGGHGLGRTDPIEGLLRNTKLCPCPVDPVSGLRPKKCPEVFPNERCFGECRCHAVLCLHRTRLHLPLAKLGKTLLTPEERSWLAAGDDDGGANLVNAKVPNPVFLYDQTQMYNASYWDDLASFLGVSEIPNEDYYGSHGRSYHHKSTTGTKRKSLCVERLDYFRSRILGYSYELGVWIQNYWLPVAADPHRPDVVVAGSHDEFWNLAESYKKDPCGRLVRRESDGVYVLKDEYEYERKIGKNATTIRMDPVYGSMDIDLPPQCEARESP